MALTKATNSMIAGASINVLDFGADPTGAADSQPAIQSAINSANLYGAVYIPTGVYKIGASLVPSTSTYTAVTIYGDGPSTQLVNEAPVSNPTWNCSGVSSWTIQDMSITGKSTNTNVGILVDGGVGATESLFWRIERCIVSASSFGIHLRETNSGVINQCRFWPQNQPYASAPSISGTEVGHFINMGGGYVHDVSIIDFEGLPIDGFAAGTAAIYCDCTSSINVRIRGGLMQGSTTNARYAINASNARGWLVDAVYLESALMRFSNAVNITMTSVAASFIGGSLEISGGSTNNVFNGVEVAVLTVAAGNPNNTFTGCKFASITDSSTNRFINCSNTVDMGADVRVVLPAVATVYTANCKNANINYISIGSGSYTIAAPTAVFDGCFLTYIIKNDGGGALGAATWDAVFRETAWTNPASGKARTVTFVYDSATSIWWQTAASNADI